MLPRTSSPHWRGARSRFLVEEKVKGGVDEVRNVGGRDDAGLSRERLSVRQPPQSAKGPVVPIGEAEQGAGPQDQGSGMRRSDPDLGLDLAPPAAQAGETGSLST
jgi:hypothetical protein